MAEFYVHCNGHEIKMDCLADSRSARVHSLSETENKPLLLTPTRHPKRFTYDKNLILS